MNIPDIIQHTLEYIPHDAHIIAKLSLISRQWHELTATDNVWKNIFLRKYPMATGVLNHNFKWAYGEMAYYMKHTKKPITSKDMKFIVMGSTGCGKSALTVQLVAGVFVERYDPTIEDSYRKQIPVDDTLILMDILDTVVDTDTSIAFSSMVDIWIQTMDGFLMVCSLTDSKSLEVADNILKKVYKTRNLPYGSIPVVLAANKCDLEVERTVQWEDVETLACKYNIQNCLQTSAKTNHNVYTAFCKLAELAGCSFAEEFAKLEKGQSLQDQKKKCHVM